MIGTRILIVGATVAVVSLLWKTASPVALADEGRALRQGSLLLRLNHLNEAGEFWQQMGNRLSTNANTPETLKQAAFAHVLATITLEKAGNVQAYKNWALATQYYLEANTIWPQQRDLLADRLARIADTLRKTSATDTGSLPIPEEDLVLMELETLLNITHFKEPSPGLQAAPRPSIRLAPSPSDGSHSFYGRPLDSIPEKKGFQDTGSTSISPTVPSSLTHGILRKDPSPLPTETLQVPNLVSETEATDRTGSSSASSTPASSPPRGVQRHDAPTIREESAQPLNLGSSTE